MVLTFSTALSLLFTVDGVENGARHSIPGIINSTSSVDAAGVVIATIKRVGPALMTIAPVAGWRVTGQSSDGLAVTIVMNRV